MGQYLHNLSPKESTQPVVKAKMHFTLDQYSLPFVARHYHRTPLILRLHPLNYIMTNQEITCKNFNQLPRPSNSDFIPIVMPCGRQIKVKGKRKKMSYVTSFGARRTIDLCPTLSSFHEELQQQHKHHSTLNFTLRSKVNPNIYKYQKIAERKQVHSFDKKKSHQFSFKGVEVAGKKDQTKTTGYSSSMTNYKNFPKRKSSYLRNRNKTTTNFNISHKYFDFLSSKGNTLTSTRNRSAFENTIEGILEIQSPEKDKGKWVNFTTFTPNDVVKRRVKSSRSAKRSSQRFSPWDLQAGFGKIERF